MNALVYVDIDRGIHKVKLKNALNEKQKTMWVFFFYKYGKFWSILRDKKVDLKPLFSEEWLAPGNVCFWVALADEGFVDQKYKHFVRWMLIKQRAIYCRYNSHELGKSQNSELL